MTVPFDNVVPPDILIEREVDRAIDGGHRLPRWGWPVPPRYNGAWGLERIQGWQKVRIAGNLGLLDTVRNCGLCGVPDAPHFHSEIYFRPLTSRPICRACHFHVHRRFGKPDEWRWRVQQAPHAEGWVRQLQTIELSRAEALEIAKCIDVFAALGGAT